MSRMTNAVRVTLVAVILSSAATAGGTTCSNNCQQGQVSIVCMDRKPCQYVEYVQGECVYLKTCPGGYQFTWPSTEPGGSDWTWDHNEDGWCVITSCTGEPVHSCQSTWGVYTYIGSCE